MADDNMRQVVRSDETVVAGQTEQTTVRQTSTSAAAPVAGATTVQTTAATTGPSDRVVAHNYAERVIDPAADKAAAVGWVNKLVWFIVGLMAVLLAIRFVLLLAGADPNSGFGNLIYGLTNWMVAPFNGLLGTPLPTGGTAAVAGQFAPDVLVAIVVYLLIGLLVTKLAELMLGTNRTTGTVVSETERKTKI